MKGQSGAPCCDVGRGSLPPVKQSKPKITTGNVTPSFFGGQIAPLPLFDSRAAAATAASCCTHAATADAASPRRWGGTTLVSNISKRSYKAQNAHEINRLSIQRLKGNLQKKCKLGPLCPWQTDVNSTGEYKTAADAARGREKSGQTKAVGCTASPTAIEAYAKSPRPCSPPGSPRGFLGHEKHRRSCQPCVDSSNSFCSYHEAELGMANMAQLRAPAERPDITVTPVWTRIARLPSVHCLAHPCAPIQLLCFNSCHTFLTCRGRKACFCCSDTLTVYVSETEIRHFRSFRENKTRRARQPRLCWIRSTDRKKAHWHLLPCWGVVMHLRNVRRHG